MVEDARETDRAEEDRIVIADLREPVGGHHRAGCKVVLAAPREMLPLEAQTEALGDRIDDANSLRNDLAADAVSGNGRDLERLHQCLKNPSEIHGTAAMRISAASSAARYGRIGFVAVSGEHFAIAHAA